MTQKTISLNEKAYKVLKKLKKENESYSELIIRLCSMQESSFNDPLLEYAGIFGENEDLWDEIEKIIKQYRENHLTNEIE
jgi:predicted CopG family antitoxin